MDGKEVESAASVEEEQATGRGEALPETNAGDVEGRHEDVKTSMAATGGTDTGNCRPLEELTESHVSLQELPASATQDTASGDAIQDSTDAASDPQTQGRSPAVEQDGVSPLSSSEVKERDSEFSQPQDQSPETPSEEEDKDDAEKLQDKESLKYTSPAQPNRDPASKPSAQDVPEADSESSAHVPVPEDSGAVLDLVTPKIHETALKDPIPASECLVPEKTAESPHHEEQGAISEVPSREIEKSMDEIQEKNLQGGKCSSDSSSLEDHSTPSEIPVSASQPFAMEDTGVGNVMMAPDVPGQPGVLLSGLVDLFRCGMLTDVVLVAGSAKVPCHRAVLAASSAYFRAMFSGETVEREKKEIRLWDLSGPALRQVIEFLYTGSIDISNRNIEVLIAAANHLQLEGLLASCENHMMTRLCLENCVEVYAFADLYFLEKVKSAAFDFLADNFVDISQRAEFLCLEQQALKLLLASDSLEVDKEEQVFEAMLLWLRHDAEGRSRAVVPLFKEIRLALMDMVYLNQVVAKCDLVVSHPFCKSLVAVARIYAISKDYATEDDEGLDLNTILRHGMHRQPVLIFSGGTTTPDQRAFACFDPATKRNYVSIPHHPTFDFKYKIDHYRLVVTPGNDIYFLGGIRYEDYHFEDSGQALPDVFCYAQKERQWKPCPAMATGRCFFSACCHSNQIFVFGGRERLPYGEQLASGEAYNTEDEAWRTVSPMPEGCERWQHMAAVLEDHIYVLGGWGGEYKEFLDSILQYAVPTDSWTCLNSRLPRARAEGTAVAHEGRIYILGGCNATTDLTEVDVWLPERDRFRVGPPFPELRKVLSVTLQGDAVYVCGGILTMPSRRGSYRRTRVVESRDLYRYDLREGAWSKEVNLVQYGVNTECAAASVNLSHMTESDFVSHLTV